MSEESRAAKLLTAGLERVSREIQGLSESEALEIMHCWEFWARAKQLPPDGGWTLWLVLAGRGFGKTRTGAEWVRQLVESGKARRIALVAPTAGDVRDVMVEGESGLMSVCQESDRPVYEPSKRRLTWPNGAIATCYSAEEPNRLRGPQHDAAWCDEIAAWRYESTWDMLQFGLRLGEHPRVCITTTPRPTPLVRALIAESTATQSCVRGSSYENRDNLSRLFFDTVVSRYEGTRLGRQELYAEILEDNPGALWRRDDIDTLRVDSAPALARIVVAVDPAVTNRADSDETGIVVVGVGHDGHGYVLEDISGRDSPATWARKVAAAFGRWKADRVVAEVNQGGDLVLANLRTVAPMIPVTAVHATRGKQIRAEPIAALYEQGRMHHVGMFATLEDQMCDWDPMTSTTSPDRLDALVWGATDLLLSSRPTVSAKPLQRWERESVLSGDVGF